GDHEISFEAYRAQKRLRHSANTRTGKKFQLSLGMPRDVRLGPDNGRTSGDAFDFVFWLASNVGDISQSAGSAP
ncbi:MAG: hypothetical protein WCC35_12780, partial [Bradyrhizobium sp.]